MAHSPLKVPRGAPYSVTIVGLRLECAYPMRSWFILAFLAVWLIGWAAASVVFTVHFAARLTLWNGFLIMTLWSAWTIVALIATYFRRSERLVLDGDGLLVEQKTAIKHVQRRIPIWELKGFFLRANYVRPKPYWIEVRSLELPAEFAAWYSSKADYAWLVQQLNKHLDALKTATGVVETPAQPPEDCRWSVATEANSLSFERRGRFSGRWLVSQPLVLLVCFFFVALPSFACWAIWSGVNDTRTPVSGVIVAIASTLLALFFVSVGTFGAISSLLEPVRRTTWRFTAGGIRSSMGWGVRCWRRSYRVIAPLRLRVESEAANESPAALAAASSGSEPLLGPAPLIRLVLLKSDGSRLCAVKGLSEGEALWMAHLLTVDRNSPIGLRS